MPQQTKPDDVRDRRRPLLGVNLAGGEYGSGNLPGRLGWDYIYPAASQIDWYARMGLKLLRVPFLSGRLIRTGAIYMPEVNRLMAVVDRAKMRGMTVVLDRHEYAMRADGTPMTAADAATFRRSWRQLAAQFRSRGNVMFGLMNEPNKQKPEEWMFLAKAAVTGIREVAAVAPIALMGSWWGTADDFAELNGQAFDAAGFDENVLIEVHQYFDGKGGKPDDGHRAIVGKAAKSFGAVTEWARARNRKLFLGEFGFTGDPGDMAEGRTTLEQLTANADVWWGATLWAGGLWWAEGRPRPKGPYPFSVEPRDFTATACAPQLELLRSYC